MKFDFRFLATVICFSFFLISCKREDANLSIEEKLRRDANLVSYVQKTVAFEKAMKDSIKMFTDQHLNKQFIEKYRGAKTLEEKRAVSSNIREYISTLQRNNFKKNGRLSVNLYKYYVVRKNMPKKTFWGIVHQELAKERDRKS